MPNLTADTASPGSTRTDAPWTLWNRAARGALTGRLPSRRKTLRLAIVMALDFVAVAATMAMALQFVDRTRAGDPLQQATICLLFATIATSAFFFAGLYRRSWRFLRFDDCIFLAKVIALALIITWIAMLAIPAMRSLGAVLIAVGVVQGSTLTALMGAMRGVRRHLRERRKPQASPGVEWTGSVGRRHVLLLGPPDWASPMIELIRADHSSNLNVVGVLLPDKADPIDRLAGVPVLGGAELLAGAVAMLEERGRKPQALILCDDGHSLAFAERSRLIGRARHLGLELGRVTDPCRQLLRVSPKVDIEGLPVAQLLGRPEYTMERSIVADMFRGARILVTGAGGTIGSELVKQLASFGPAEIVLLDHAEHALYTIEMDVREQFPDIVFHPALCSIRQSKAVRTVFDRFRPEFVFHAAALKHVPMVEANPCAGVHTNVIGTRNVADAVCEFGVRAMVQVSTDKAVNPVGMMGSTKRLGELYCQALDLCGVDDVDAPRFITVRFGNVLGSSGSIVPLFKRQIAEGRDLTVTHPDITRFFMTVQEAVQLILHSSSSALKNDTDRGNIYVLDMGTPVRIADMARQMILLAGLELDVDIAIRFVGLRPGEKLYEELFDSCEQQVESQIARIFEAHSPSIPLPLITRAIRRLDQLVADGDDSAVCRIVHHLVKLPNGSADMSAPFGENAPRGSHNDDGRLMSAG